MNLNKEQRERYSRQIIMQEVGEAGQEKLLDSSVLVVGAGGLGSPLLYYLTAAGVGRIGIMDGDTVDLSNLQRQILHTGDALGKAKTASAAESLTRLNPDVKFDLYHKRLNADNACDLINRYDLTVDASDNFSTKYLVNDASVLMEKPYSHAGVLQLQGQIFTHIPKTSCLRCIFPDPPPAQTVPSGREAGILGAVAGTLGAMQAAEVIKFLLGEGKLLTDSLLTVDIKTMQFRSIKVKRNPQCPICGKKPTITDLQKVNYKNPLQR
ncbi:MAG: HesA/MoeB/ThiF family protein [bacterium]